MPKGKGLSPGERELQEAMGRSLPTKGPAYVRPKALPPKPAVKPRAIAPVPKLEPVQSTTPASMTVIEPRDTALPAVTERFVPETLYTGRIIRKLPRYGFIEIEGIETIVYFSFKRCRDVPYISLRKGDSVSCTLRRGDEGQLWAHRVRPVNG